MKRIATVDFISKYQHIDFQKMARTEACPRVRERLLAIFNLMSGKNRKEAAASVGRHSEWLRQWILRYDQSGYEGLFDHKRSGQPKYLTDKQETELVEKIIKLQDQRDGGRITAEEIRQLIIKEYNVEYKHRGVYDLLYRLGLSWVSSRSKHPKSDPVVQKKFKQTFKARVSKIKNKKKAN